jgi:hypothetical protein
MESLRRGIEALSRGKRTLPSRFCLVMDNTCKDQKNTKFLNFLARLVASGVFQCVEWYFLPAGHCHNDIDQYFSRISDRLMRHPPLTLPSLVESIQCSYHQQPEVAILETVVDGARYLKSHFRKNWSFWNCHGIRISRDISGNTIGEYKANLTDSAWLHVPDDYIIFDASNACQPLPPLRYVAPTPVDTTQIQHMVERQSDLLSLSTVGQNPPISWWRRWIRHELEDQQNWCRVCSTLKKQLSDIIQKTLVEHRSCCKFEDVAATCRKKKIHLQAMYARQGAAGPIDPNSHSFMGNSG